jgi:succinoglycan biosynthesis protein ExoH
MFIKKEISDRIEMLRFLMIFGVVVLHVPNYVPLAETGTAWFDVMKAFFQHAVFRATVPVLTLISGYLLFSTSLYKTPLTLWKKKLGSLAIPFLVFNLGFLCVAYVAQAYLGIKMSYDLVGAEPATWLNAIFGATSSPINYPLNFLRDMIVLVLLAPLFGVLLRNLPFLGALLVFMCFYDDNDGALLLRDTMAIQFYIGGLMAMRKWDVLALDKYATGMLALFLAACVVVIQMRLINRTPFVLIAPFLVWPAASLLVNTRLGAWAIAHSKYSFFIFVTHAPLLMVLWFVYGKVAAYLPYQLFWVAAPFAVAGASIMVYKLATAVAPDAFAAIVGRRARKPAAFVERRKTPRPAGAPVYSQEARGRLAGA